jgi:hypothetical protein
MNTVTVFWMIFRPEGHDVLYFWNGNWATPVHIPPHEEPASNWYWNGCPPQDLDEREIDYINSHAMQKSKRIMTLPRKGKQRYQIIARGVYDNENL